jgi:CheY-like chemotaxis protein
LACVRIVPMEEPTTSEIVVAVVDDMFFAAKIRGAAEHSHREVKFIKSAVDLEQAGSQRPEMVIVDLNSQRFDPIDTIKHLKSHPDLKGVPILGFLSHVQVDLKKQAEAAGCDLVMARSAFSLKLPEILAKHRGHA